MKRTKTLWWIIGGAAVLAVAGVTAFQYVGTGSSESMMAFPAPQAAMSSATPTAPAAGAKTDAKIGATPSPSAGEVDQIPEKFAGMAPPSSAAEDRVRAEDEKQEHAAMEAQMQSARRDDAAQAKQYDEALRDKEPPQAGNAMDQLMASQDQAGTGAAAGSGGDFDVGGGPPTMPGPQEKMALPPSPHMLVPEIKPTAKRPGIPQPGVNALIGTGPPQKEIALPDFPWPPPTPSERMDVPPAKLTAGLGVNPTLAGVGNRLADALNAADYSEFSYFRAPGGFALVARLEHIQADGAPVTQSRFLPPNTDPAGFSLPSYLKQLFFAPQGFYRLIVFVVTDQPVIAKGAAPSVAAAEAWLRQGADRLPPVFATLPFTANHQVSALIYEFRKSGSTDVSTLNPGLLDARTHLQKAGLYAALTGGR